MKYLVLLMLLPQMCLSYTQVLISGSSSSKLGAVRALVLESSKPTNKVTFSICDFQSGPVLELQFKVSNCELIGKRTGYSIAEIENRIQDLEKKDKNRILLQTTYVILGTTIGAVSGGILAQRIGIQNQPSQMYALISYFASGILIGGASGLTLTVLTKNKVSDLLQQKEDSLMTQTRSTLQEQASLVVLKSSLQKIANDFQEILLGIP